jgi:hypothetical protein
MIKKNPKMLAVIAACISWDHLQLLAEVIEDEAAKRGYHVVFINMPCEFPRMKALLEVLDANAYLISRKIAGKANMKEMISARKPVSYLDDHYLHAIVETGIKVPSILLNNTITAVRYICH